jgi:hypothetical protein
MGIYIFNTDFLFEQLLKDADNSASTHDFGHDIIPSLCCAGIKSTYSPNSPRKNPQPCCMCRIKESDLYCVKTPTLRIPELMQFDKGQQFLRFQHKANKL